MTFRVAIYPYKQGSHSAHALAKALKCVVLKKEHSKFHHSSDMVIINWAHPNCRRGLPK